MELAARDLRMAVGQVRRQPPALDGLKRPMAWRPSRQASLARLHTALTDAAAALDTVSELAPDFVRLHERARLLAGRTQRFAAPCDVALVRWADVSQSLRLVESPLDIADTVRTRLLAAPEGEGRRAPGCSSRHAGRRRAPVVVHAAVRPAGRRGAAHRQPVRLRAPGRAVRARPHRAPGRPGAQRRRGRSAGDAAACLGGRTMVLTTTLRALRSIGDALAERFPVSSGIEVLVQGALPKRAC